MFEQEVLLLPDTRENNQISSKVRLIREGRITDKTKENLTDLKHLESLSRTAERGLQQLRNSNVIPASIMYAFMNLSGQGELMSFGEIKETFNTPYTRINNLKL